MKAATVYGKLGWKVLPIEPGGKRPLIQDWPNQATSDLEQINEWIAEYPTANIGIAAGEASGFWVLDVDTRHDGDQTLAALEEEHGELPKTVQARTGSGGSHYLFALPDFPIRNSAGKLGAGLDVRATGGQIVVAPSRTPAGLYSWINPPWSVPIAHAPEWLLDLVRVKRDMIPDSMPTGERPAFPPASPEVLQAARDALELHGPAIEGQGGDAHTMQAGALLTHDFALTPEEAWQLLLEWNDTCDPPWGEDDLRRKLRNGEVYGSRPYGCRRTLDVIETVRKLATEWKLGPKPDPTVLVEQFDALTFKSKVQWQSAAAELQSVIGFPVAKLGLRTWCAPLPPLKRGDILLGPDIHRVADESAEAISPRVFQRNGILCEVITDQRAHISELEIARIQDLMSECAKYMKKDSSAGAVVIAAPQPIASLLHSRRKHDGVRPIESVTTAPVFLADGSILQERGYNTRAKMWMEPAVHVAISDAPTLADAQAAVGLFRDLLSDFKFATDADFSSWVAALLSPLVKSAIRNAPVPLFCVSASSPGAGKTLLTQILSAIVMGNDPGVYPYNPKDPAEWTKRLTAFVKAASPITVFDNVNGPFGDKDLDRLITSTTWTDRILGVTDAPPLPNVTTWLATGNNIEPVEDTVRRVLMVRVEVDTERPQERTDFKRPLLQDYALEHREELLSGALTILRAYHVAGRPAQALSSWGSFTAWSQLVRGALVWARLPDPFLTQQRASADGNEGENDAHDFWISIVERSDGSPGSIVEQCARNDAQGALGLRDHVTAVHLRKFLARFIDKPRAGKRIRRLRDQTGAVRYIVEQVKARN